jgi:hypothetical protein
VKKLYVLAALLAMFSTSATASERAQVCARYQTEAGWSDSYKVEATITKGSDLNRATSSFDYNAFATYVVIFWSRDEVSVIEMDWPYVTYMDSDGKDQRGRKWQVRKGSICL